jgi:competence protein ComEC
MADPIVILALALLAGAPLALAPIATATAFVACAVLLRARASRGVLVGAAILMAIGGLRARAALTRAGETHARVVALLQPPERCFGEGVVVSSPVVVGRAARTSKADGSEGQARVDVEIERGTCGDRAIDLPIRAKLYGAPEDLGRGDRVAVVADLAPVHLFLHRELPDARAAVARSGVAASGGAISVRVLDRSRSPRALVDRARAAVRARIEATFHPEAKALARALVLGETDLDAADDEAFRVSGLSHLLAVSGTHLVIAVLGFTAALRAILARVETVAARVDAGRVAAAVAVPTAWIYADFAGGSGSAVRAAAMVGAAMLARALGRRTFAVRALACSLLALAAIEPLVACDISFALSAGATAGLVVLQKPIAAAIVRGPAIAQKVLAPIATTLSAMAGCAPILAILAPTVPVLGIVANLLAAPLGELAALPICLLHTLLAWAPSMERGAAIVGSGALLGVRAVARWSAALGATIPVPPPTPFQLATIAATAVAAWAATSRTRRLIALAAGAALWAIFELAAQRDGAPRGKLRITALDVGQGDSLLIDLPDGSAMLIDGGGMVGSPVDLGARVIQPVLRVRRRRRLAAMVLSHPHPDHFGGLVSTLPKIEVGELWDSGQGEDQGAGASYASLLASARSRGVTIQRPRDLCGAPRVAGGATIEVLAPCPGYAPDAGANDNSVVLKISFGRRSVLLVGDAEREEEHDLIRHFGDRLHVDLLKVGHHGSRTSSSARFLDVARPRAAIISAGVRNRFGHPHPLTLSALGARGIDVLRTDRGGAIVWETDGDSVRVTRP